MKWAIRVYALVLLAYTGYRTYDFMVHQLPDGDTSSIVALLFLFATEIGMALWHEASINHATTQTQHGVASVMTWVDFVGSLGAGIADMIIRQTFYAGYQLPPLLGLLLLYGLPIAVALNVAAALIYLANESDTQIERAKKQLRFRITNDAIKQLQDDSSAIAQEMRGAVYNRLYGDVTGNIRREFMPGSQAPVIPGKLRDPEENRNGRKKSLFSMASPPWQQKMKRRFASTTDDQTGSDRPNVDLGKVQK